MEIFCPTVRPLQKKEKIIRYNIERWHEGLNAPASTILKDCERLEVVKQVIKAIDNAQNFKAMVVGAEKEERVYQTHGGLTSG